MKKGDIIIMYTSKEKYSENKPYQKIIAIARVLNDRYQTIRRTEDVVSVKSKGQGHSLRRKKSAGSKSNSSKSNMKNSGCSKEFYRKKVKFIVHNKETSIKPLLEKLSFVKNIRSWGFYFMSGYREVSKDDYKVIRKAKWLYI
jgi:predicted RNA-binding protein